MEKFSDYKHHPEDDLEVVDVLLLAKNLFTKLWDHKFKFVGIAILAGALGFTYAHFKRKAQYISHLTFAVEEKSTSSSLSGLANQFGLDVGGGSASLFSSDNLMLLLKSKRIINQSLLARIPELEGETLFNLYLKEQFKQALLDGDLAFISPSKKASDFDRKEDSLLNVVGKAVSENIIITKIDKKASIIDVQVIGVDEFWAYKFNKTLIEEASKLYLEMKVGKSRRSVAVLEARVDSVKLALDRAMASLAQENDRNQSVVMMSAKVPAAKTQMQVQLLTAMYSELVKNYEVSKLSLEREEPVIEVIDEPRLPLEKKGKGRLTLAIITALLASIASAGAYLSYDYIKNELAGRQSQNNKLNTKNQ